MHLDGQVVRRELIIALSQSKMLRYIGQNGGDLKSLRDMLEKSEVIQFRAGNIILKEGEESDRMYFLVSGRIEVSQQGKSICTLARTGDVFGEMGVISGDNRSATVKAETEVVCLATESVHTGALSDQDNILYSHVMEQALNRILAGRLKATGEDLAETMHKLDASEAKAAKLTRANTQLERRNKKLVEQASDRFHGKRGDDDNPRGTR